MNYLVRKNLRLHPDPEGGQDDPNKDKDDPNKAKKEPEETDTVALAKALKEARENSVSKAEYDKLKAENKRLVSEIINGDGGAGNGQQSSPKEQEATIEELKQKLYGPKCGELSNLEFWKNTLALRKAVIDKGDPDPFLPVGAKISPSDEDVDKAQNVADVVQQCIDEADGNSEVFTALLQSRTNNDSPQLTMRLKKLGIKF